MGKIEWTEDMGEISGFGHGYERACRAMLDAAVTWFDAHPDRFKNKEGELALSSEHPDFAALETAILAAEPEPSGAMFGAVVGHAFFIRKNGVEKWSAGLREREAKISPAQKKKNKRDADAVAAAVGGKAK